MAAHLLIVEDDEVLADQIAQQMSHYGHSTTIAHDGLAAIQAVGLEAFDAIVLDRMLPRADGVSVLQKLRQGRIATPILMLTALGQAGQKVEGLDAGADDYVVKPVDPAELNARINALIRARKWQEQAKDDTIRAGDILVSPSRHSASRAGKPLVLQHTELKILLVLARNANSVVTRAMLLDQVWNYDFEPATNLVEAHIRRLRIKLTEQGDDPIRTIRGVGYMLQA